MNLLVTELIIVALVVLQVLLICFLCNRCLPKMRQTEQQAEREKIQRQLKEKQTGRQPEAYGAGKDGRDPFSLNDLPSH